MNKYKQIYKDDLSKITYAAVNGISLADAGVKPTKQNVRLYLGIKSEIDSIRESGQGIVLPN
jgi:hypothetical protein